MPSTMKEERRALAAFFETLPGLHGYAVWPDNIQTPAALVRPARRVEMTMNEMPNRWYDVEILMSLGDNESAQVQLDEYLEEYGPLSVIQAMRDNPKLGGAVAQSTCHGWKDYGARKTEAHVFVGAVIVIEIWPLEN
jgi:hypothetical protein